jgi:NADH-quinone oxidoreductase subunit E
MDDSAPKPTSPPGPRPAEERLAAALEALTARDRLVAERDRRLRALESVADHLVAATARHEELSSEIAALHRTRLAELAERDARVTQLEAALAAARAEPPAPARPEDLKEIKGIGPAIEALLHGIGIARFRQIADLSAEQRRSIGDLLGVFQGRIERDDWVGQARALAESSRPPSPADGDSAPGDGPGLEGGRYDA